MFVQGENRIEVRGRMSLRESWEVTSAVIAYSVQINKGNVIIETISIVNTSHVCVYAFARTKTIVFGALNT